MKGVHALLSLCFLLSSCFTTYNRVVPVSNSVSPYMFGLKEAKTDVDRYYVLLATHKAAIARRLNVDYTGIKTLNIEVPNNLESIPLSINTDFRGCTINVRNTVGDVALFSLVNSSIDITLSEKQIGEGYFSIPVLRKGLSLVILEDKTPWVEQREGYNYSAYRKDILVVKDGKAENAPIMPYDSKQTVIKSSYIPIKDTCITISNVIINRTNDSCKITTCFQIKGAYNVHFDNVVVNTKKGNELWRDSILKITDCANVYCNQVQIRGTYSMVDKYGYGFELNNIYNFEITNSVGYGNWGVFGTNNINKFNVIKCDLNRVDIHLYGRDVYIADCVLSDGYNQFSGVYGEIRMERCSFSAFTPLINGTSYNAYVPYDLYITDCIWNVTEKQRTLLNLGSLDNKINKRVELREKEWPNIFIDGLTVRTHPKVKSISLIHVNKSTEFYSPIGGMRMISLNHIRFLYENNALDASSVEICDTPILLQNDLSCIFNDIHLLNGAEESISQADNKYQYPGSIKFNLHSKRQESIIVSNSSLSYNVNSNYEYNIVFSDCILTYVRCTPFDAKEYSKCHRLYKNCRLYLNNSDSDKYYLDNLADYIGCTFIPCSNREIDFVGKDIMVQFRDCHRKEKKGVRYTKRGLTRELSYGRYNGKSWSFDN